MLQSLEPVTTDVNSYLNIDESDEDDVEMVAKVSGRHGSVQLIDGSMGSDVEDDADIEDDADVEDDAERRLSDETRRDDHDLASKATFRSKSKSNLFGSLYLIQ